MEYLKIFWMVMLRHLFTGKYFSSLQNHGADTLLDELYSRGRYFSQYCDISLDRKIHGADTSFD